MAGQTSIKTFEGGMNKDIDISFLAKNQYLHSENYQIISDESSNNLALEVSEGNTLWFDVSSEIASGYYLVGHCYIDPYLVLFYTQNTTERTPAAGSVSKIVRVRVDKDNKQKVDTIYTDASGDRLNFSDTYPISAVGIYETDDIVKVYWTDGYNPVRFCNILDDDLDDKSTDQLELLPDFPINTSSTGRPEFVEYTSGRLQSSSIQYAYQFYNKYGQTSAISITSPIIPIHGNSNVSYVADMSTVEADETLNKGVKLYVTIPSGIEYDGLRLIALDYNDVVSLPSVRIVKELDLDTSLYTSTSDNLYIVDNGSFVSELTYEEFLILERRNLKAKSIEIKDNRLFLANLVEEYFDVSFDARAFRFDDDKIAIIKNSDDSFYRVYGDTGTNSYATGAATTEGDWEYYEDTVNWGAHDGAANAAILTDSGASWIADSLIGFTIYNITDGSSATITDNDGTTVTGTLSGGTDNDWDVNDIYWINRSGDTGSNWTIPSTCDCINPQNDPSTENTNLTLFTTDGSTFGAEGKNIKVEFVTDDVVASSNILNYTVLYDTDDNPNNPENVAYYRNFRRQEIYRIGIVFFNEKLQVSSVKWITDLKMPAPNQYDGTSVDTSYKLFNNSTTDYFRLLGLKVTLKDGAMPSDAVAWQVVSVPRKENDRSVIGSGPLFTSEYNGSDAYIFKNTLADCGEYATMAGATTYNLTGLATPEILFNKNLSYENGDFINVIGLYDFTVGTDRTDVSNMDYASFKTISDYSTAASSANAKMSITDGTIVPYSADSENEIYTIGGTSFRPYVWNSSGNEIGFNGTRFVMTGSTSDYLSTSGTSGTNIFQVSYRKDNTDALFGGNSYADRQQNEYVGISQLKYDDDTYVETYEGDSFIDWWNYMYSFVDISHATVSETSGLSLLFPVETTILPALSLGKPWYKQRLNATSRNLQEIAGIYTFNSNTYEQEYDLYTYNSVYSKFYGDRYYLAEIPNQDTFQKFGSRILASDKKTNGETEDSMSIFRQNNFLDLDGNKGSIYKLINFKNQLYFWQNTGFGIASVNPRSLIQDNNPGVLTLGTGDVLDRFDYIEENIGSQNQFGIIKTRTGLYWGDNNHNELFKFDGSTSSVSKLKNIQNWINSNGQMGNIRAIYDHKHNDVLFTITFARTLTQSAATGSSDAYYSISSSSGLSQDGTEYNVRLFGSYDEDIYADEYNVAYYDTGAIPPSWTLEEVPDGSTLSKFYVTFLNDPTNTYTVAFNEKTNAFTSFYSFEPTKYIALNKNFLSSNDDLDLYIHNSDAFNASKATYYGTTYDSIVTVPFNDDYPYTKVFDTFKWMSESVDSSDKKYFKDTLSEIEFYNDYQWTGNRELYYQHDTAPTGGTYTPIKFSRRERTFSTNIPRSIVSTKEESNPLIFTNVNESPEFKPRMRDKYIVAKLTYDNTNGYTFSLPFVSVIYRKSIR